MTPAEIVAMGIAAKELIDDLPPSVVEAVIPALKGLKSDNANDTRKAFALAMARAHKAAVEKHVGIRHYYPRQK